MRNPFACCIVAAALGLCASAATAPRKIACEGEYNGHLQGVATDGQSLFWSFTVEVVRTDMDGKILATTGDVPNHHGDLCVKDGVVYVAVNLGRFNQACGGKGEIRSYDAATLKPLKTWPIDMPYGAGGMTYAGDRFFVVGGLPATVDENVVCEYDGEFRLVKRHALATGFTLMGIQTAAFEDGRFLFGLYGGKGSPGGVLTCPRDLSSFVRRRGPGDVGIVKLRDGFWTGRTLRGSAPKKCRGEIVFSPGYPESEAAYEPKFTGKGELRVFFGDAATNGWTDCGYELTTNGYHPLMQAKEAFTSAKDAAKVAAVPTVELAKGRNYSASDLVRGIRRTAENDEVLAVHFPAKAELAKDAKLSAAYDAMMCECKALGVKVREQ